MAEKACKNRVSLGSRMHADKQMEDAVFFAAMSIPDPEQRRRFLDQSCAGNPALREVVEGMLSVSAEVEPFFAKGRSALVLSKDELPESLSEGKDAPARDEKDEYVGTLVGRYKLLQRIGEGGCGVVYLAGQEEPVRRKVALKIIKLGMDTKSVIARFDAERQALALMDHPNIARVLDAGATEAGRPYFVMELVRGFKITEYCDQNNLGTGQRLDLFVQVCHAIQHAHQKGIIHRDVKPSNVLITLHDGAPVPKVIDFGIAKAIEGKLTEQTLFTAYEQLIGTPAYMSPEQAEMSGLDVDTRSDIYSLGVLLYELLTGRTPFNAKELVKSGVDAMRRTLREEEPQRPSAILTTLQGTELRAAAQHRGAEPPRLISQLQGDLDWIIMKALEKDRTRRYETANGLAMDVRRYLNNEPIMARPPSRMYRFQKLVRRNKAVFAAGAAVALALIFGLGLSSWLFLREREAVKEQARLREAAEISERREAELRRQAEDREKLTEAVMLVNQGKYEEAEAVLEEIKAPPTEPSLDGISALRSVGEWLAVQGRWKEASDRFSALLQIDKLEGWNPVTLDYQACGVLLAELGNEGAYRTFCWSAVADFAGTTNGDAASRILKTCLLMPHDEPLMNALAQLAAEAEKHFVSPTGGVKPGVGSGWEAIPLGLWKYRVGNYHEAEEWSRRCLEGEVETAARSATLRALLAMSHYQRGQNVEADAELAKGRRLVEAGFHGGLQIGLTKGAYWFDWVFAHVLLREAVALIGSEPAAAPVSRLR